MNQEAEVNTKKTKEVVDFGEETSTITEVTQMIEEMVKVEVSFQGSIKTKVTSIGQQAECKLIGESNENIVKYT